MTTINSDNNGHEQSHANQTPASGNGYGEHHNNGESENGYNIDTNDSQHITSSQTGYSQGSGSDTGSKPEDDRKLFVGGLSWDTTQDDLREYFSNFGTIIDCSIKHDPNTGRSRGFAFLVFESKDVVEKILSQNDHFVKGRKVDPKPAHRRMNAPNNPSNNHMSSHSSLYGLGSSSTMPYANMSMGMGANSNPYNNNNRKVFIGGLDPSFPDSQLREYFSKFGKIDEIDLPYDKERNERRPFCFISFQTEQAAQEVLRLQRHTIGDISVDVKRAKPKTANNQQQKLQQHMYDVYGQQNPYGGYGAAAAAAAAGQSYGASTFPAADGYAHWNTYAYNQQANPTAYSSGSSGSMVAPSSGNSSYSQYPEYPPNSHYQYAPSNQTSANDYYSQYGYGAQQQPAAFGDANAYGGGGNGGYDYGAYYPPTNAGMSRSMGDNGIAQTSDNSSGNQPDYEHDNLYGKAKTSIVSSPNYHPYARS